MPPATLPHNYDLADQMDRNIQDKRNVFVVHGRNLEARNSLFRFLRSIGLRPLEWSQAIQLTGKASPFIGEILDVAFSKAQAVVVLFTPDDEARLREPFRGSKEAAHETELTGQARPNVLFEAGMAMGRNPDRTVMVELGDLRPFSDIAGRHTIKLDNSSAARHELAQRLETAGCAVDLTGRDWHTEGDFTAHEAPISLVKPTGGDKSLERIRGALREPNPLWRNFHWIHLESGLEEDEVRRHLREMLLDGEIDRSENPEEPGWGYIYALRSRLG